MKRPVKRLICKKRPPLNPPVGTQAEKVGNPKEEKNVKIVQEPKKRKKKNTVPSLPWS
jgi:hypothetical protein